MSKEEQLGFDFRGWSQTQANETPLGSAPQETCGSCRSFEPELKPLSRKPEGYCLAQYNRPRLTTDKPCSRWRARKNETEDSK